MHPTKDRNKASVYKTPLQALRAFDTKGKELSVATLVKRLQAGNLVLAAADDQPVPAAYLKALKDDTLVLVGVLNSQQEQVQALRREVFNLTWPRHRCWPRPSTAAVCRC